MIPFFKAALDHECQTPEVGVARFCSRPDVKAMVTLGYLLWYLGLERQEIIARSVAECNLLPYECY